MIDIMEFLQRIGESEIPQFWHKILDNTFASILDK